MSIHLDKKSKALPILISALSEVNYSAVKIQYSLEKRTCRYIHHCVFVYTSDSIMIIIMIPEAIIEKKKWRKPPCAHIFNQRNDMLQNRRHTRHISRSMVHNGASKYLKAPTIQSLWCHHWYIFISEKSGLSSLIIHQLKFDLRWQDNLSQQARSLHI